VAWAAQAKLQSSATRAKKKLLVLLRNVKSILSFPLSKSKGLFKDRGRIDVIVEIVLHSRVETATVPSEVVIVASEVVIVASEVVIVAVSAVVIVVVSAVVTVKSVTVTGLLSLASEKLTRKLLTL